MASMGGARRKGGLVLVARLSVAVLACASCQLIGGIEEIQLAVPASDGGALSNDPDTAATFSGDLEKVSLGSLFAYGGTASCSFEAWIRPAAGTGFDQAIMSKMDNNNVRGWLLYVDPALQLYAVRNDPVP